MRTEEAIRDSLVLDVGGELVEGWILPPNCPSCDGPRVYFLAYGATCCPTCNLWLELLCPEPDCVHCRCRPATPFPSAVSRKLNVRSTRTPGPEFRSP